jgi:predicted nucleic acid-binding protein
MTWFEDRVLAAFAGRILAVDQAVARRAAPLHVPDPGRERDTLIAASALTHGLALVTRNVADLRAEGLSIVNPWVG